MIAPYYSYPKPLPILKGPLEKNSILQKATRLFKGKIVGPESFAVNKNGNDFSFVCLTIWFVFFFRSLRQIFKFQTSSPKPLDQMKTILVEIFIKFLFSDSQKSKMVVIMGHNCFWCGEATSSKKKSSKSV